MDADERERLVQEALSIVRGQNADRYLIDDVDEAYIRSLPDWRLERIIDPSSGVRYV